MNVLDVVIIAAILAAGVGGWRLGFIARAFAWAGVALGAMAAGGAEAKRAFDAMMTMKKIDVAAIEEARRGVPSTR